MREIDPDIAERAKGFRRALTPPEAMLWARLKGRKNDQPVFRRQVAFERMIFDFYCPAARLAVEIDGASHWETGDRDVARDLWLQRQGVTVARIPAGWVYRDAAAVADGLKLQAAELVARNGPYPPRPTGAVPLSRMRERKG
jgi:very-short-patch-repair endonuclease